MYNIPSIQCFKVFESICRLGSFTKAAEELGVSQGAVSQHIKTLEIRVGFKVFIRQGRTIRLTDSGKSLLDSADNGLKMIENTIAMEKRKKDHNNIVISIQPGFAIRWLFPRLLNFSDQYPNTRISVNSIASPVDFDLYHANAGLDYGPQPAEKTAFIFREHLFPVCSPEFAKNHGLKEKDSVEYFASKLNDLSLLGDEGLTPMSFQYTWPYWAESAGINLPRGLFSRYNQANITLQLAELGHGVALGRTSLVLDALKNRTLIQLTKEKTISPCSYFLVDNPVMPKTESIMRFERWLISQTREIENYSDC